MINRPLRLPPDDIGEWTHVPVPVNWDRAAAFDEIALWIDANIHKRWYVRDAFQQIRGYTALSKIYSFEDESEGMLFAMSWT